MNVTEADRARYSTRAFLDKPVDHDTVIGPLGCDAAHDAEYILPPRQRGFDISGDEADMLRRWIFTGTLSRIYPPVIALHLIDVA